MEHQKLVRAALLLLFATACSGAGVGEEAAEEGGVKQVAQPLWSQVLSGNPGVLGRGSGLFWHHSNGDVRLWDMHGSARFTESLLSSVPLDRVMIGTGDFNGDRNGDLLWRLPNDEILIWQFQGDRFTRSIAGNAVAPRFNSQPAVPFFGDLNDDGISDIIWTGAIGTSLFFTETWTMAPDDVHPSSVVSGASTLDRVIAVGNFDGDLEGRADILYRVEGGDTMVWVSANAGSNVTFLGGVPLEWTVKGVGDFNADLTSDIVWYNNITGDIAVWFMSAGNILSGTLLGPVTPSSGWSFLGVGDVDRDGVSDIVWKHSSGWVSAWIMNKQGQVLQFGAGMFVDPNARFAGIAELGGAVGVSLFEAANFGGRSAFFTGIDSGPAAPFGVLPDNSASSILVARNMEAHLFQDPKLMGFGQTITSSERSFVGLPIGNDTVSSLYVEPRDGVFVRSVQNGVGCDSFLGIGYYPTPNFLLKMPSSCNCAQGCPAHQIRVPTSVTAQVCREPFLGGECQVITAFGKFNGFLNPANGQLVPIGSMRVTAPPGVVLYTDWHFNGSSTGRGLGVFNALSIPDNSLSSIRLTKGTIVKVCRDPNLGGVCQTLTDNEVDFRNLTVGNDTVSSIQVSAR